ncbi:dTMP kinase [Alistipes finegoldii]|uniref:dTMP kinase n=1 Tax=Alistipes finegoldii TaxID=214856 RepID=UPI0025A2B1BD|nr:thymidylate kinase [Alistipes finegoldii]
MFIVLEGLDGAGKSTQIRMLRQLFADRGVESEYVHFPRFDSPVYGQLIARFLRGEFGGVQEVDPYLVALIFAGDRADAAPQIRQWLAEGKAVVLDRYVYSNVGFQCAKLPAGEERDRLADWIVNLEFGHNALPRPDLSLFLDVPFAFTERKLSEVREGDDRDYLQGGQDIHEASLQLQQDVRSVYLASASKDPSLRVVDCSDASGAMESPEGIFAKIRAELIPILGADA